jgi:hypothetical protein
MLSINVSTGKVELDNSTPSQCLASWVESERDYAFEKGSTQSTGNIPVALLESQK